MNTDNKQMDFARRVFDFLCRFLGYDWNEIMHRKAVGGSFSNYIMQHELFDAWREISAGNGFLASEKIVRILQDVIDNLTIRDFSDTEKLRSNGRFLIGAAGFLDEYKSVQVDDRADWLHSLESMILLTAEEKALPDITQKCPRSMVDDVWKLLNGSKSLNIYRYRGDSPLNMDNVQKIKVADNFVLADNVASVFLSGRNGAEDELVVYIALNIDPILDFSWFLVALNNGDNWWMVTDEPKFANPSAKGGIANRGAGRYRRDDYEKTVFPYMYLDRIEEWRRNNTSVVQEGRTQREFYTVPLQEWPVQCRVYLNLLIEKVIEKIQTDNDKLKQVKLGQEFLQTLQIEGAVLDSREMESITECFSYEKENAGARKRIENLILHGQNQVAGSLVKVDAAQVTDKISLWKGNFMDADTFRSLEAWAIYDDEYERRRKLLKKAEECKNADEKKMAEMLDANLHNRLDMLFAAKEMQVFIFDPDAEYEDDSKGRVGWNKKHIPYTTSLFHSTQRRLCWIRDVGGTVGEPCGYCKKRRLNKSHKTWLDIQHYSVLAWLAGVEREQLPYYFCNYQSHLFDTYCGNHLLQNINPLYLLQDVMSRSYPNGYEIGLNLCSRCRTALYKKAMDKGFLVVNKKTCRAEGVFSPEEFKAFLVEKGVPECTAIEFISCW